VKEYRGGEFTMVQSMPFDVQVGDAYSVYSGCDKTIEVCAGRFNNALNFRGEPHIPGVDELLKTASTR
jgi:uncharacterized phage protein (TIGR02218 family)